jgi:PilZ domain
MTQPRNEMEHRWGERIRMDLPVQVSADEVAGIRGCMRNLSLSGALLRMDSDLRMHALIEVSVKLPQPSRPPAILLAHVSRKREEDVGIEWCEFAPTVVKDLLRSPSMRLPL